MLFRSALHKQLAGVKYKFIATATPSPNETLEIINYAHVLGICDRGQILTTFFQRNSTKAGELTLHPQHEDDFWLWVSSWAVFITQPSDLGHPNGDYELPKLNIHWIEVETNAIIEGGITRDGQIKMYSQSSDSLPDAARIKRATLQDRLEKAMDIMFGDKAAPGDHWIVWHHLEDERKAINASMTRAEGYADIYGSMDWKLREKRIVDFSKGNLSILATKPEISGVGCNFQKHCHKALFLGINYSFDDLYQALKRIHRFGQKFPVDIYLLYVASEYDIVTSLKEKWRLHNEQREKMRQIVLKYGLDNKNFIEEKKRSFIQERKQWKGENYTWVNTDCVFEWFDLPENSIKMFNTSFPFGNHYEYTDKYNDFGHNQDLPSFIAQLDFLIPEMYRTLEPGRIAAIHLKNRIHYGSVTGNGFSTFHRFTHAICDAMEKHGFHTMGFHYIPTDVVAENNQTYRLGFTEMCKDATKMGSGIPEEIWLFRKAPTSNANAYADIPVTKGMAKCPYCGHESLPKNFFRKNSILADCRGCHQYMPKEELLFNESDYSLATWQIDADSFWHTSGNRLITPMQMKQWGLDKVQAWWKKFNKEVIYDYDAHIELLEQLDHHKKLSRTFTTLPMQSNTGYIWNDVNRMQGLNLEQSRRKQKNHICPQPLDEARRTIRLYSNKGDLVADPFGGIGTTGTVAIEEGRKAFSTELNNVYAKCGAIYHKEKEAKMKVPTLFDMLTY